MLILFMAILAYYQHGSRIELTPLSSLHDQLGMTLLADQALTIDGPELRQQRYLSCDLLYEGDHQGQLRYDFYSLEDLERHTPATDVQRSDSVHLQADPDDATKRHPSTQSHGDLQAPSNLGAVLPSESCLDRLPAWQSTCGPATDNASS